MANADQRVENAAITRAAAEMAAAQKKAAMAGPRPKVSKSGSELVTAIAVVGVVILTLALSIWAGR